MALKFSLLTADDIEVKVKKITSKGAIALLYKTARVDMNILDAAVTPMGWKCSYREVKGNLYCEISIYDKDKQEWVSKEDCGIESREDNEGNQRKGEASDAFKRAGFKWGIGRELYTAPFTFLTCPTKLKSDKKVYELSNPFAQFSVKSIGYDVSGKINALVIVDDDGKQVYKLGQKPPVDEQPDTGKTVGNKKPVDAAHQIANALIRRFGNDRAGDMLFPITGYKTTKDIPGEKLSEVLDLINGFEEIA